VQRDHAETFQPNEKRGRYLRALQGLRRRNRAPEMRLQRVDHDVAGKVDPLGGDALAHEIRVGRAREP